MRESFGNDLRPELGCSMWVQNSAPPYAVCGVLSASALSMQWGWDSQLVRRSTLVGEASHTLEVDVGVGVICAHCHTCNVWAVPDADIGPAFPCLDKHALSQRPLLGVPPDAGSLPPLFCHSHWGFVNGEGSGWGAAHDCPAVSPHL